MMPGPWGKVGVSVLRQALCQPANGDRSRRRLSGLVRIAKCWLESQHELGLEDHHGASSVMFQEAWKALPGSMEMMCGLFRNSPS